ncbi:MAG TPA: VIT and VWA domain-containing protein [Pyrinomonadaceae bacterium]|nr:VIT and VWA domain-containing protein [Pyrinomonadaceae bacterium]
MNLKSISMAVCIVFAAFFFALSAYAQGVIIPIICDMRPCTPRPIPRPVPIPNALPVKSIQIDTKINGQVATTHLEQVFRNDTPYTLEGTYFFPIPETASIVEFAIWENGKKLVGEVRTREEARRIYDEIVRRQRDPGLLEYAGKDLFQASIFPIPPNSDKKLEMTYSQVLKAESGTVAYRYPLGTGRNLWQRQADENVRRNLPAQTFGTVSGKIEIVGREALRNIYSPSHQVEVKRKGENSASVSFETSSNDNDFQLFYGLSNNDFGMSLLTYREPGKDGYFLLQISPKDTVTESQLVNKDIVFVLDTSGSMADEGKMEKARNALLFGVRTLRDGDRFNVINFAGEEHLFEDKLIASNTDNRRRGEEFVKKLQPNGGTNINDALKAALKQFDSSDRPKMLVFLTDGRPTVGEANIDKIIKNSREIRVDGLRMFTFGVGYDVNTQLLDKLAEENSGTADYVEPKEDLEIKVSNFFTKVNSPVLTGLEMDFGGVQTDLMYPRALNDIFKGSQLTIIGRYRNTSDLNNITLHLKGKTGRETRTFNYSDLDFPLRADKNEFLPRLWATRRVGWLIEQIRSNGENKELRDEIVDLGTRYGIVTPYTSYLATENGFQIDGSSGAINSNITRQRVDNLPKGTTFSSQVTVTGEDAVRASKDAKRKQETVSVTSDEELIRVDGQIAVKKVGVKTFYLENGVWIDSEFKEEAKISETKLQFASNEYFDLVAKEKELAQFFALGEQVVVVWKGKVYRIIK